MKGQSFSIVVLTQRNYAVVEKLKKPSKQHNCIHFLYYVVTGFKMQGFLAQTIIVF